MPSARAFVLRIAPASGRAGSRFNRYRGAGLMTSDTAPDCANCEALREEIADYLGHRTDAIAGKVWAAQHLFSRFESALSDLIGEFDGLGHDDYDQSLEIYGVPEHIRLDRKA